MYGMSIGRKHRIEEYRVDERNKKRERERKKVQGIEKKPWITPPTPRLTSALVALSTARWLIIHGIPSPSDSSSNG